MSFDDAEGLVAAAVAGEPAAIAGFVRATQADLWRFLAHLVDAETAEDLAQETYLRALRSLPSFRGESSVRTWLLAIARRVAADELRHRSRRPRTTSWPEEHAEPSSLVRGVGIRDLIRRLPLDRREPFVFTQVLGLTYAETAALLDCPIGTVRSRVARARDELYQSFAAVDVPEEAGP